MTTWDIRHRKIFAILTLLGFSTNLLYAEPLPRPVTSLEIPSHLGAISEQFVGAPGSPLVIHIQESHSSPEAQENISEIIRFVQSRLGTRLLAVEGASGKISTKALRRYPNTRGKQEGSQFLMSELILDGASHAAIFSAQPTQYFGVEDGALYEAHLVSFLAMKNKGPEIEKFLEEQKQLLLIQEKKCSPELAEFYRKEKAFEEGRISLEDYLGTLNVIARTAKARTKQSRVGGKSNEIASSAYGLLAMTSRNSISAKKFFEQFSLFKKHLKSRLMITEKDRQYDQTRQKFNILERVLRLKAGKNDLESEIRDTAPSLPEALRFYRLARLRDQSLLENFLKGLTGRSAFLVTGGFHTDAVTRKLRKRRISYVVITPRIMEFPDTQGVYERRLAGDLEAAALAPRRVLSIPGFSSRLENFWNELDSQSGFSHSGMAQVWRASSLGEAQNGQRKGSGDIFNVPKLISQWALHFARIFSGDEEAGRAEEASKFLRFKNVMARDLRGRVYREPTAKVLDQTRQMESYRTSIRNRPGNLIEMKYLAACIRKLHPPPFLGIPELENLDYVVLDVETTGLSSKQDRIIELTAIRYRGVGELERFSTLIRPEPGMKIPWIITLVTGITRSVLYREPAPLARDIFPHFAAFLEKHRQAVLVGHNIEFDLAFLAEEFRRAGIQRISYDKAASFKALLERKGIPSKNRLVFDTVTLAQHIFPKSDPDQKGFQTVLARLGLTDPSFDLKHAQDPPELSNRKLGTLLRYLWVPVKLHRTVKDVVATKIIFLVLAAMAIRKAQRIPAQEAERYMETFERARDILRSLYPVTSDRYETTPTDMGIYMETDIDQIVEAMQAVGVEPGMRVLDPGCGDGRVVIAAALFGAEAAGIESDQRWIYRANRKRREFIRKSGREGVGKLVQFERQDFFATSFADHDVIFYSAGGSKSEAAFERKILREMKPGARLVIFTHVPFAGAYFQNLKLVESKTFYQVYEVPVTVSDLSGRGEPDFSKTTWMNAWDEKWKSGVIAFHPMATIQTKTRGRFQVRLLPKRELSGRLKPLDFREVSDQNLFRVLVHDRSYLIGVNRYPGALGHGLIYEDLNPGDEPAPQVLTGKKLWDLLMIQMRNPFFRFFFNGGPQAGSSIAAYHAQIILEEKLPIQDWKKVKVGERENVGIYRLLRHPSAVIVFEGGKLNHRAHFAGQFLALAKQHGIPHNVMIASDGAVHLFLRDPKTSRDDLGAMEHSGIFLARNEETYQKWDSERFLREELASVALKEPDFRSIFGDLVTSLTFGKSYISFAGQGSSLGEILQRKACEHASRVSA